MAGAHRRYEMTLSSPSDGASGKINASASTRMPVDDLASFFAHEAMHVLAMNNRDWHNTFDEDERGFSGCGPSQVARPYPPGEVERICGRIRSRQIME